MSAIRIILGIISIIYIIITLIIYLKLRKELKSDKKLEIEYIENRIKRFNVLLICSIVLSIITIIVNFINSATFIRKNINIDVSNYNMYIQQYRDAFDVHSELQSFPSIVEQDNVLEFSEFNRDGLFDGSYFICLKYQYNDETFDNEYDRIKNLSIREVDETNGEYLAYIISDDTFNTKEYVLVNKEEMRMVYIFCQLFEQDEIDVDKNYFVD